MSNPPPRLERYKQTPVFDQDSIPAGLLRRHTTKAGVWARIHVLEGELVFRLLEPTPHEIRLSPSRVGEVDPQVPHEVERCGPVRFYVEFLRPAEVRGGVPADGPEDDPTETGSPASSGRPPTAAGT